MYSALTSKSSCQVSAANALVAKEASYNNTTPSRPRSKLGIKKGYPFWCLGDFKGNPSQKNKGLLRVLDLLGVRHSIKKPKTQTRNNPEPISYLGAG